MQWTLQKSIITNSENWWCVPATTASRCTAIALKTRGLPKVERFRDKGIKSWLNGPRFWRGTLWLLHDYSKVQNHPAFLLQTDMLQGSFFSSSPHPLAAFLHSSTAKHLCTNEQNTSTRLPLCSASPRLALPTVSETPKQVLCSTFWSQQKLTYHFRRPETPPVTSHLVVTAGSDFKASLNTRPQKKPFEKQRIRFHLKT